MLRLAAFGALVATIALVATTGAGAQHPASPVSPAAKASFISAIKSKVCDLLDGVETVELPISLANLVKGGDLEASTVILFGANKALCGGGHVEKLFSLAHDWLLGAVIHPNLKLPGFSKFRIQLPTLVHNLVGLPTLDVRNVSFPTVAFSQNPVGVDNLVPLTVNWLATPFVKDVILEAIPLSSNAKPYAWPEKQNGFVGTQSAPLGLSSGRWQLCIRPKTVFKSARACDYPFWITICPSKAGVLNSVLARQTTAAVSFYGSQVGVAADSAYGTASFDVDYLLATAKTATLNVRDFLGDRERFFAYWAWNLGEGWHTLHAGASIGPFGSAVAGHFLALVTISSVSVNQC